MLVKSVVLALSVAAALIATPSDAQERLVQPPMPTAGPLIVRITECLMAANSKNKPPCEEPKVAENGSNAERSDAHLARAAYFFDIQKLEQARLEVDAALGVNPENIKARHFSARLAMTPVADLGKAEAELALARQQAPNDPDIRATYATLLKFKRASMEAAREFEAIFRKNPEHLYSREQHAALLIQYGNPQAALADLNLIIDRQPTVRTLIMRSSVFQRLGHTQPAVADISSAIALSPLDFTLLQTRAEAYEQAELDDLAIRDYNTLLAMQDGSPLYAMLDGDRAYLLTRRAFTFVRTQKLSEATEDATAAAQIGGAPATLRLQVFLRRKGFDNVPLDGKISDSVRTALKSCFGLKACFQEAQRAI